MAADIEKLKEKTITSKALPKYFRDLILREIEEKNATPMWARMMLEKIIFIESFLKRKED